MHYQATTEDFLKESVARVRGKRRPYRVSTIIDKESSGTGWKSTNKAVGMMKKVSAEKVAGAAAMAVHATYGNDSAPVFSYLYEGFLDAGTEKVAEAVRYLRAAEEANSEEYLELCKEASLDPSALLAACESGGVNCWEALEAVLPPEKTAAVIPGIGTSGKLLSKVKGIFSKPREMLHNVKQQVKSTVRNVKERGFNPMQSGKVQQQAAANQRAHKFQQLNKADASRQAANPYVGKTHVQGQQAKGMNLGMNQAERQTAMLRRATIKQQRGAQLSAAESKAMQAEKARSAGVPQTPQMQKTIAESPAQARNRMAIEAKAKRQGRIKRKQDSINRRQAERKQVRDANLANQKQVQEAAAKRRAAKQQPAQPTPPPQPKAPTSPTAPAQQQGQTMGQWAGNKWQQYKLPVSLGAGAIGTGYIGYQALKSGRQAYQNPGTYRPYAPQGY